MAQSVEMSAVTWPLLKLCFFSVISTVWEMVLLSETTQKKQSQGLEEILLDQKCQGLFALSH